MASTGLDGPYPLTATWIADNIEYEMPGAYALGSVSEKTGNFRVAYVGRSDGDVGDRLFDHVDKYSHFKFKYYETPKKAFEKECELYHNFGGLKKLKNKRHPQRPKGTKYECPYDDCEEDCG